MSQLYETKPLLAMCRSRLGNNKAVWSIEEFAEEVEVFGAKEEDGIQCLEPAQRVTLKLESGKFMRFQPHTGAQCNVIPVHLNRPTKKRLCYATGATSELKVGSIWWIDVRCYQSSATASLA